MRHIADHGDGEREALRIAVIISEVKRRRRR